jgi:undecaprenyl-diphosphatase
MSYFDAIILGMVQGLTEFLPVSSSGHLVLVQELLGVNEPGLTFEILAHVGTLATVIVYFRRTIWRLLRALFGRGTAQDRRMILWLVIGSIPAGIAGLLFEDFFEQAFASPLVTSVMLLVTGLVLLSTRLVRQGKRDLSWHAALITGCGQALAIMPGISRSGTTISAGIFAGVTPSQAAEFSFLLSIPAIGGATLLKAKAIADLDLNLLLHHLIGALLSFLFGLLAVHFVLSVVKRGKFDYFAYYCFAVGALGLYLFA